MMLLSLILFAIVLAVITVAAMRDLSGLREVEPGSDEDDASVIRVAV